MHLFPHLIPVVYVDELEAGRNTFRGHFQNCFELFTCSETSLALQVLHNRPGCVLLTQLRLNRASGLDFISEVQLKFPRSQCILLHTEWETSVVEGSPLFAHLFRSMRIPYLVPVLQSVIQSAYEITWNQMQMGAKLQELETYRSDRDWLTYKLDTEIFEPIVQLTELCRSVIAHQDNAPAHEFAQFLFRRLSGLESGRARFRSLYRGSRVELLPDLIDAQGLFGNLKKSICEVYGFLNDQMNIQVIEKSNWVGDCEKITLVLFELLSNAALSSVSPDDPVYIQLIAQIQPDFVRLDVIDQGKGIAPTQHERVFRMFESDANGNRSGMGLFIVRETLKQLGGDIQLKSEVGIGSTFQLRIPNLLSHQHRFAV